MKRTPLSRRTPLQQGSGPLRRAPMMRAAGLRQVSTRARRTRTPRTSAERLLGRDVHGCGVCARCGRFGPVNGHERVGRAQGGDPSRPDCLLCPPCNGWCEDFPQSAAWLGWKVSRLNSRRPGLRRDEALRVDGSVHCFTAHREDTETA